MVEEYFLRAMHLMKTTEREKEREREGEGERERETDREM